MRIVSKTLAWLFLAMLALGLAFYNSVGPGDSGGGMAIYFGLMYAWVPMGIIGGLLALSVVFSKK